MPAPWKQNIAAVVASGVLAFAGSALSVDPVKGKAGDLVLRNCTAADGNTVPGAECGYAIVPLDYTNPNAGVAKIALGRYNATASPRKGVVFVNPGGPGGPGIRLATASGPYFQQLVGAEWDILGFDPRGIGLSEPKTTCFVGDTAREEFITNTVLDRGYDVSPNLDDPSNRPVLIQTQRDANGLYEAQFQVCAFTMGETLKYMGTTSVVRDIEFINTLIAGKDSLINFYGLSYGSVMGQYLVNMFPKRVGRVAIDGVVDADAWANKPPYLQLHSWLNSTDATYKIFFEECAKAGPAPGCALAKKKNEDPNAIMKRVEDFVNGLYAKPLAVKLGLYRGIFTNGRARQLILGALEVPERWQAIARAINDGINGDAGEMQNIVSMKDLLDLERSAVSCNDQRPFSPPSAETIVDAGINTLKTVSRFFWSVIISEPDSGCQYWPVTPPERYLGPWNKTLNNPILIISNTHDPATPLVNGQLVHSYFPKSSGLLVQDGVGHTSTALTSNCTMQHTRAYFANGTLPPTGTVCQVDEKLFPTGVSSTLSNAKNLAASVGGTRLSDFIYGGINSQALRNLP